MTSPVERACAILRERTGRDATVAATASGRIELVGNHTDHQNGPILASAVDLTNTVVAVPRDDSVVTLYSEPYDRLFSASAASPVPGDAHDTELLIAGIADAFASATGAAARGWDGVLVGGVPPGSGLSSSAAFGVAVAAIVDTIASERSRDPLALARAVQHAEHFFIRKPSGLMDQLTSAVGGVVTIDFGVTPDPTVRALHDAVGDAGYAWAVIATGGDHADLTDAYAAIPTEMRRVAAALGCELLGETSRDALLDALGAVRKAAGDRAVARALHFFDERDRVGAAVAAIGAGDVPALLEVMRQSGDSSARLLQNTVAPGATADQPITFAVEAARRWMERGGIAGTARVHGGGFAGTVLALLPEDRLEAFRGAMAPLFGAEAVTPLRVRAAGVEVMELG